MDRRIYRPAIIGLLLLCLVIFMGSEVVLGAENPKEFFQGKKLRWVVASGPGGGQDLNARTIAPFLEKEIGVTVIIENRRSNEGINYVYNQGKRNGLTLGMKTWGSIIGNDLMKAPGVRYDVKKLTFITDVFVSGTLFQISPKLPYKSLDAIRKAKGLRAGAASAKGSVSQGDAVMFELLGLDGKFIPGFKGKTGLVLAMSRGEIDFIVISDSTAISDEKNGHLINLFALGYKRNPLLPDVPALPELGVKIPKEMKAIYNFVSSTGHPLVLPPGVPEARVEYLRRAFQRLNNNKDLRNAIKKRAGRSPDFVPGEELQQMVAEITSDMEVGNKLNALMKKYTVAR